MSGGTDRDAELARHRAAIDALDREILERLNARAKHAQAIGTLKGGVAYRPEREAQVLARLQAANRDRFRTRRWHGSSARRCPRAWPSSRRCAWATSVRRERSRTKPSGSTSGSWSTCSPTRRSTTCSARRRAARPITPSFRSRTRRRAPSGGRSISCSRRRSRSVARSGCASARTCCPPATSIGRHHERLFASAIARAMRAVAGATPAQCGAHTGCEQRGGRPARRRRARIGCHCRRERRRDLRAQRPRAAHRGRSRTTRRASGCSGRTVWLHRAATRRRS